MGSKDISYKVFYTMIMEIHVSKSLLVRILIIKCFFNFYREVCTHISKRQLNFALQAER